MALTPDQEARLGRLFTAEVNRRQAANDFQFVGSFLAQPRNDQKTFLQALVQQRRTDAQTKLDEVPSDAAAATTTLTTEVDELDTINTEIALF